MTVEIQTNLDVYIKDPAMEPPAHWCKILAVSDDAATMTTFKLPSGTENMVIPFPGITTLTTLWVAMDKDMEVTVGDPAENALKVVKADSVLGFSHGELPAATALTVSYTSPEGEMATMTLIWAGH